MLRAFEHLPAGLWDRARQVDAVLLDFDGRHRRRGVVTTLDGVSLLVDLPAAVRLREGDGLRLEDGGIVRVRARPEPLLSVRAPDVATLVRLAWHLGNRHLAVQVSDGALLLREDHVIASMLRGLGGAVEVVQAAFDPEPGAYAGEGGAHGHDAPAHGSSGQGSHGHGHGPETHGHGEPGQDGGSGQRGFPRHHHASADQPHTPHAHNDDRPPHDPPGDEAP